MTRLSPAEVLGTEHLDRTLRSTGVPGRIARTLPVNRRWVADVASDRVADALADWLGDDLSGDVMAGYAKVRAVRQAAQASLGAPDDVQLVELGRHTVNSSHRFNVDVTCEATKLAEVEVEISLNLTIPVAAVSVQDGAITAVRFGGGWTLGVELAVEGEKAAWLEREITLEREFRVHVQVAPRPDVDRSEPTHFVPVPVPVDQVAWDARRPVWP